MNAAGHKTRVVSFLQDFVTWGAPGWRIAQLDLQVMGDLAPVKEQRDLLEATRSDPDVPLDAIEHAIAAAIRSFPTPVSDALLEQFDLVSERTLGKTAREDRAARQLNRTGRWLRGPVARPPYNGRAPRDHLVEAVAERLLGNASPHPAQAEEPGRDAGADDPVLTTTRPPAPAEEPEQALPPPTHAPPEVIAIVGETVPGARESRYVVKIVDVFASTLARAAVEVVHPPRGNGAEVVRRAMARGSASALSARLVFDDVEATLRDADALFLVGDGGHAARTAVAARERGIPVLAVPRTGKLADEWAAASDGGSDAARSLSTCDVVPEVRSWLETFFELHH